MNKEKCHTDYVIENLDKKRKESGLLIEKVISKKECCKTTLKNITNKKTNINSSEDNEKKIKVLTYVYELDKKEVETYLQSMMYYKKDEDIFILKQRKYGDFDYNVMLQENYNKQSYLKSINEDNIYNSNNIRINASKLLYKNYIDEVEFKNQINKCIDRFNNNDYGIVNEKESQVLWLDNLESKAIGCGDVIAIYKTTLGLVVIQGRKFKARIMFLFELNEENLKYINEWMYKKYDNSSLELEEKITKPQKRLDNIISDFNLYNRISGLYIFCDSIIYSSSCNTTKVYVSDYISSHTPIIEINEFGEAKYDSYDAWIFDNYFKGICISDVNFINCGKKQAKTGETTCLLIDKINKKLLTCNIKLNNNNSIKKYLDNYEGKKNLYVMNKTTYGLLLNETESKILLYRTSKNKAFEDVSLDDYIIGKNMIN